MAAGTKRPIKGTTTMQDIADEVGVSVASVSYAVNGREGLIGDATRAKILATAKRMDYQPNQLMKAMRTRKTEVIGVMLPSLKTSFFPEIINGIECALADRGYHAIMCQTHSDTRISEENLSMLRQRRIDGLIVTPKSNQTAVYRQVLAAGIKTVFVDGDLPDLPIPCVRSDDILGAYLATRHLIRQGHQRIATLRWDAATSTHSLWPRMTGYQQALQEAGLPQDESLIGLHSLGGGVDQGYEIGKKLLTTTDATAIFAPSDHLALGVMKAARELRLDIPDQLGIVGYANLEGGRYTYPGLSTVDQKPESIGQLAVKRLMAMIDEELDPLPRLSLVAPELLVRESSVRPH